MELPKAQEAYVLLKSGAIDGLSIGYEVAKAVRDRQTGVRHLLEVSLWEISLVTFAANQAARITAFFFPIVHVLPAIVAFSTLHVFVFVRVCE